MMEGALWKWTNYWNGWQLRWFVLEDGVLAYYKSQDDVNSGCKGSVKVSTCEIEVPPHDGTRLTISIPGEQHLYLRAATSQDRQQWVVALGSAKACVTSRPRHEALEGDTLRSKRAELRLYCDLLMQQAHQVKESVATSPPDVQKLTEATGLLSLTCDTFTQTLDECVKLVDASLRHDYPHHHGHLATDAGLPRGHAPKPRPTVPPIKRSSSYETSERKT